MTWITAVAAGLALLVLVDVLGALLSRSLKFNYAYLLLVSLSFAFSPLVFTGPETSAAKAAAFSLIIYGPESLAGLPIAYRINPHGGAKDYRTTIDAMGFTASQATCIVLWFVPAAGVYFLK